MAKKKAKLAEVQAASEAVAEAPAPNGQEHAPLPGKESLAQRQPDNPTTTPEATQERVISKRALEKGRKAVQKAAKKLEKLVVHELAIDQLIPNDWNPNRQSDHDFELLLRSMEEDGFTQPIVALEVPVDGKHIIIDGEHRWRAAATLGIPTVPTVLANMTPEQARIATIRHNRARGSHDIELEAQILRDLQSLGAIEWAQDSLMLDDTELEAMLKDVAAPEALADQDYGEAWVPDDFTQEEADLVRHGHKDTRAEVTDTGDGGSIVRGMTQEAIEATRRREELIARAKTSQDMQIAKQQSYMYRVALVFSGDEGQIVKKALGDHPAEALLEMCRAKVLAPK